ncbi:MAG: L-2-amino-thiazoline-4-carboxylic acid hydrolase [Chloroflexi bacterium]|nr:L-2-amino-thiazoline-4-carboxylic acid hydrolase [Chloroflexota bacterium]
MAKLDKSSIDVETKWRYMIPVSHQFYIYARQVAGDLLGEERADDFVQRFWQRSGRETGRLYLTKAKLNPDDLIGLARAMERSSAIMGEDTEIVVENEKVFFVHNHCPWPNSYADAGLPESCQGGCDAWFREASAAVSPRIRVRTTKSIPSGDGSCVRELWIEKSE